MRYDTIAHFHTRMLKGLILVTASAPFTVVVTTRTHVNLSVHHRSNYNLNIWTCRLGLNPSHDNETVAEEFGYLYGFLAMTTRISCRSYSLRWSTSGALSDLCNYRMTQCNGYEATSDWHAISELSCSHRHACIALEINHFVCVRSLCLAFNADDDGEEDWNWSSSLVRVH